ncbi:MAG: HAMP domain-containing histidine kinase [Oscillospiraceae bacterium]|nr:HAMP domain-containing histidine kinase [Oscillospiraceae bacterium]
MSRLRGRRDYAQISRGGKRKRFRGITRRWIVGSLLWVILILAIGAFVSIFYLRESFYNYARLSLLRSIERVYSDVPTVSEMSDSARERALRTMVQEFSEREKFELMTVNSKGEVLLTSSGFTYNPDEPMDDFFEATEAQDLSASMVSYSNAGERVVAHTKLFRAPIGSQIAGIRMVTSLRRVDAQLRDITYILAIFCALVLFFSIFSGSYFIRSIALPIRSIGNTAKRISGGDFDVRIDNKFNDEIGDLCDIINDMAVGLADADRMKNDFISSISHELRTPLTSIRGWGETLLTVGADDRATFEKGMRIITGETDRLSLMVEDLLDFSRLQTGRITVDKVPIDIVAELSEAVMTFEKRAEGLGIRLLYEEPPESGPVLADRNRMRQVFSNLLDNALKYSRRDDSVSVYVESDEENITVNVKDTGVGIPGEDLSRVSERFFRAGNSATGSGIGLAVVKEIMALHDGALSIESEFGSGTLVKVSLPLLGQ